MIEIKLGHVDPDVAEQQLAAYRLLERLLVPHPSEEVVAWIPLERPEATE